MNFKEAHLELEFRDGLDVLVRLEVEALDSWSRENGLPAVVVTQVLRAPAEQEKIYTRYADSLIYRLKAKERLTRSERALALQLSQLTRDEVMSWARGRFSWHMVGQAVDMRARHYTQTQLDSVVEFLAKRCKAPDWELLEHDIAGPHLHLARRDAQKRKEVH